MATIITRTAKGSALTHAELDANFVNINADIATKPGTTYTGTVTVPSTTSLATTATSVPGYKPSLDLDFVNSNRLDPRITVTRVSTATYYDGKTFAKAEENILTNSQAFNSGGWGFLRCTATDNADVAPDGTTTATLLSQTTGQTTAGLVSRSFTVVPNSTYSIYAKASTKSFVVIQTNSGSVHRTWFNLSTGTVGTKNSNHTASITSVGSGWYRCIVTSAAYGDNFGVYLADADNATTVTDSGSILIWGAQLEQRNFVTPYIATTTAGISKQVPQLLTAAVNTPRFDYDPITGACKGLLVEGQRTNLILTSEFFAGYYWSYDSSISGVYNATIAPNGTLTASSVSQASTVSPKITQILSYIPVGSVTFSIYCKVPITGSGNTGIISVRIGDYYNSTPSAVATFDIINLTTNSYLEGSGNFSSVSSAITNVGGGWYRVSLTTTTTSTINDNLNNLELWFGGYPQAVSNGTMYIWGAQLEQGSAPSSYIPTGEETATRAADVITISGSNFTSWFNQTEGTLLAEYTISDLKVSRGPVCLSDGTTNNRMIMRAVANSNQTIFIGVDNTVTQWNNGFNYAPINTITKSAFAYAVNNIGYSTSGNTTGTDTLASIPQVTQLRLGTDWDGGLPLNGHLRTVVYWPQRVSDQTLQVLTQ